MRTFSKSFSLAGMRVGIAVAQPAIIDEFMKTKDSYNVNVFSQVAAEAAMRDYDWMLENAQKVCATRKRLRNDLIDMGFDVPDSQTNFLLAQWNGAPSAREIFENLRTQKILVRYFDVRRLENALRISIGTDKEIDRLLEALDEMLPER
jgi:histidinol-phosphate aminotransferase